MGIANSNELIIILDFGSQYNQLIARRVRECKVYCELIHYNTPLQKIRSMKPCGIIFSGGPSSVYEKNAPKLNKEIFELGVPILGICYGMQLMAHMLGGEVGETEKHEYGKTELTVLEDEILFEGLNPKLICWMSHGDIVKEIPHKFKVLAHTPNSPIAAMANFKSSLFGVQFHPEVVHTPWGIEIIRNFLYKVCGCKGKWTTEKFLNTAIENIRETVRDEKVICALSGGVDSSASAVLVNNAVGKQLHCIFVNHGFLRKEEPERVQKTFFENFRMNLIYVDESDRFLKRL